MASSRSYSLAEDEVEVRSETVLALDPCSLPDCPDLRSGTPLPEGIEQFHLFFPKLD